MECERFKILEMTHKWPVVLCIWHPMRSDELNTAIYVQAWVQEESEFKKSTLYRYWLYSYWITTAHSVFAKWTSFILFCIVTPDERLSLKRKFSLERRSVSEQIIIQSWHFYLNWPVQKGKIWNISIFCFHYYFYSTLPFYTSFWHPTSFVLFLFLKPSI